MSDPTMTDAATEPQPDVPQKRGPVRPPKASAPADSGDGMSEVIVMDQGVCIDGGPLWATEADATPRAKGARIRITTGEAEFLAGRNQVAII